MMLVTTNFWGDVTDVSSKITALIAMGVQPSAVLYLLTAPLASKLFQFIYHTSTRTSIFVIVYARNVDLDHVSNGMQMAKTSLPEVLLRFIERVCCTGFVLQGFHCKVFITRFSLQGLYHKGCLYPSMSQQNVFLQRSELMYRRASLHPLHTCLVNNTSAKLLNLETRKVYFELCSQAMQGTFLDISMYSSMYRYTNM